MISRSSVLLGVICSALLMAVIPAGAADPDEAKSAVSPEAPLSAGTKREDAKLNQPVSHPANGAPARQGQDGSGDGSGDGNLKQGSPLPTADTGGVKRAEDTAATPSSQAEHATPVETPRRLNESTCSILKTAAAANGLPLEFFARVIWRESRFKPNAIGPTTRTGHRAQGIAQFMPYTAAARGLSDPFDPKLALPEAAEFLAELRREFGNLGLAAAAYNAGPGRVHDFLNKRGGMPLETRHYVRAITGRTVEEWAAIGHETRKSGAGMSTSCHMLAALVQERQAFSIGTVEPKSREAAIGTGDGLELQQSTVQARGSIGPQTAEVSIAPQHSRVHKRLMAKTKADTRWKRRATALYSRGASGSRANSNTLTSLSTGLRLAPTGSPRARRRSARRPVRTVLQSKPMSASDDAINKIMQICRGCLPAPTAARTESEKSTGLISRTTRPAPPRRRSANKQARKVVRDKPRKIADDGIRKIMQICRGC